jgi:hypothetical protein
VNGQALKNYFLVIGKKCLGEWAFTGNNILLNGQALKIIS